MGRIPILKPREATKILESMGFTQVRQKGSHCQFRHPDGRGTTGPKHSGRDLSPFLLRQIAKDTGLTVEEFVDRR